jgi:hypothetical protein
MAKRYTKEWANNIRRSLKGKGKGSKNPFFGKTHTQEVKDILREKHLGLRFKQSKPRSKEHIAKLKRALQGRKAWNKGLTKKDYRVRKYIDKIVNEQHYKWKGNKVGYKALHQWVNRKLGKANKCDMCKKQNTKYEWANISKSYKRELNDWFSLCVKCHRNYDIKQKGQPQ